MNAKQFPFEGLDGSRLIHTYSPEHNGASLQFGNSTSRVGTGGMESKVHV